MSPARGAVRRWSHGRHSVFLRPGEVVLAERPAHVVTVLGSCVSLVVHSRRLGVGGMCHAVLPSALATGDDESHPRFVAGAVERLLEGFRLLGAAPSELTIKAFGGAAGLSGAASVGVSVGRRNVEALRGVLEHHGMGLMVADFGGAQGRKLHFLSDTGVVYLKRLGYGRSPPSGPEAS